jgi:multidrug resistance efflux pump
MSDSRRIPTPFVYRWRRFCYRYVPLVTFIICMLFTVKLWERQAQMGNGVGAVEVSNYLIYPSVSGVIVAGNQPYWQKNQMIEEGDVVCQLDNRLFLARIDTLRRTQEQLAADIEATRAEMSLNVVDYEYDDYRDLFRIQATMLDLRLDQAKLQTERAISKAEYDTLQARAEQLEDLGTRVSELETQQARLESAQAKTAVLEIAKQMASIDKEMKQNELWMKDLETRKGSYSTKLTDVIDKIVDPIRREIEVLEAQIKEIEAEQEALTIRSPVTGIIVDVPLRPGQAAQTGLPLMTVASTAPAPIISYVRQDQRVRPAVNMKVWVRSRYSSQQPVETVITQVGAQHMLIPMEQLRDPAIQEWGLPVWIEVPSGMQVRPGEMIDIIYPTVRGEGEQATTPAALTAQGI